MKMRTIIETGRETSPVINTCLNNLKNQIDLFGQILSDFSSVKSECGRAAMLEQCAGGLKSLSESLETAGVAWHKFDAILGDYKYQFDKRRKGQPVDLEGQQVMDFDREQEPSA